MGMGISLDLGIGGLERGGGAFSPLIYSPALWLRADAGLFEDRGGAAATTPATDDSDPVGTRQDQSGNAKHAVAPSDPTRAILKLAIQNGKPVLLSDGVDDNYSTPVLVGESPASVAAFFVINVRTLTALGRIFQRGSGDNFRLFQGGGGSEGRLIFQISASSVTLDAGDAIAANTFYLLSCIYDGANLSLKVNGVVKKSAALTGSVASDAGSIHLGSDSGAGPFFEHYSGDALFYVPCPSAPNIAAIETYLLNFWGIA